MGSHYIHKSQSDPKENIAKSEKLQMKLLQSYNNQCLSISYKDKGR